MYYSTEHSVYSKPILGETTISNLFTACAVLSGVSIFFYLLNRVFHFTNGIWGSPVFFSIFTLSGLLLLGYGTFTPKFKKMPVKYCNELLEYTKDMRFHETILAVLHSNQTIYLGDLVRITKAVENEYKRLLQVNIDLYLKHGEKTDEIERIDQQLATIRETQNFLNKVRYSYLAETDQQFLEV